MGKNSQGPEAWNLERLLEYFLELNSQRHDKSIAFILGSGASVSSGIPTGRELVNKWVNELWLQQVDGDNRTDIKTWATAENIGIPNFAYNEAERHYPEVYERRFRVDPDEGYAQLESLMENKHPGVGYALLAQIMA